MPEEGMSNVEVARHLHERGGSGGERSRGEQVLQIAEAILLAIVAVATAWSGYQAAKWSGRQSELYGIASRQRIQADLLGTRGGQQVLYDTTTFNAWLQATSSGDRRAAALFERRFRPEYRLAFAAWLKTDPIDNPKAPPGPIFMPQYHNALSERSDRLQEVSSETFDRGTEAREQGDDYVRNTVLLATVLFLAALAQRFTVRRVRLALLALGVVLLGIAVYSIATYPTIL
jgi:hypothetical protein